MRILTPDKEALVVALLARGGLSQRAIARRVGVARGTVRRRLDNQAAANFPRCPICGGKLTESPCRACGVIPDP